MAVLNNIEFHWVKIQTPDEYLGKKSWQVVAKVSQVQTDELTALGHKPRTGETLFFQFKRSCLWPSGDAKDQPRVVDMNKTPMDCQVGNGSRGNLQYKLVEGTGAFGPYKMFDLCAIQVTELVPYGVEDGAEFDTDSEDTSEFNTGTNVPSGTGDDVDPF